MTDLPPNIVLFGFMGTGKTAVASLLGERLALPVVEMDEVIARREAMSISRIFSERGEPYFRRRERELVNELSREKGRVIATGGGVVLDRDNIRDFARGGLLICLTARPRVILKRVADENHRPLLESGDRLEIIGRMLRERQPFYSLIGHQVDTSDLSIKEVVERILTLIGWEDED